MKIDLHVHTTGFSYCGKLSATQIVDFYKQAGYDAIVITNHFNSISKQWFLEHGGTDYHKSYFDTIRQAAEFGTFARDNDILFYQAHPFRNRMTVVPPEHLFGIEVLNTHPRHDSRNDIALAWAEKYNLHKIAGSDCHQIQDVGTSAIFTDYPVKNMRDLVHVLKNDLYTFSENRKI